MRIAVVGCEDVKRSEFINDFTKTWPMYSSKFDFKGTTSPCGKGELIQRGTPEDQDKILNSAIDEMMTFKKDQNIILDRCSLDTLVHILWLSQQENSKIDEKFIEKAIKLTHISISFLDLIIFLPKLAKYQSNINQDGSNNDADNIFNDEINNLYLAIQDSYNRAENTIFPFETVEGSPAVVEIFGNSAERIQMVKLYLDETGQPFGKNGGDSLLQLPDLQEQVELDKLVKQVSK